MKLTKKQQLERENLEWFLRSEKKLLPTDEALREYLDFSERGELEVPEIPAWWKHMCEWENEEKAKECWKNHWRGSLMERNFYALAKNRRGILIHELWEKDFNDGNWIGWMTLFKEEDGTPIPQHIAEFISKEIFKGQHAKKIMKMYHEVETTTL